MRDLVTLSSVHPQTSRKTYTSAVLPFTLTAGSGSSATPPSRRRAVVALTRMSAPTSLVRPSMREARVTVSPTSAYESRSRLPMAPARTAPVGTPMPWLSGRARRVVRAPRLEPEAAWHDLAGPRTPDVAGAPALDLLALGQAVGHAVEARGGGADLVVGGAGAVRVEIAARPARHGEGEAEQRRGHAVGHD